MSSGADPVSWLEIEPGWTVAASDGVEIGSVSELTGDREQDIFDGLAVRVGQAGVGKTGVGKTGFGKTGPTRYVPAEQIGEIRPGRVTLKLTAAEAEALETFEEPPPSVVISSEGTSFGDRLRGWLGLSRRV
ncbi:MAG TPA: hypothetical protein VG265_12090 [Gaiellaceae bacterium]|jgi:hypothetical protein|nr:hypothetical protein [Gaiellaceae bacterium]